MNGGLSRLVRHCSGLFASLGITMTGVGLLGSVLGVRAEHERFATLATGVIMGMYYVGFLLGARVAVWGARRLGHVRTVVAFCVINTLVPLVQGLFVDPVAWGATRFCTGLAMAGTYVIAESWLNHLATNDTRGRILAIYLVVGMGGVVLGQLLLAFASPDHLGVFVAVAVLHATAIVPILLRPPVEPDLEDHASMSFVQFVRRVPSGAITAAASGIAFGGITGMAAVYASRVGLDTAGISRFLAAGTIGSVVLAWPINSWSDRRPRRNVMVAVAAIGAVAAFGMYVLPADAAAAYVLYFTVQGCSISLYAVSNVYTNDWLSPAERVAAGSALVAVSAIGSILGPVLIGALMSTGIGPRGFVIGLMSSFVGIVAFVVYKIVTVPEGAPAVGDLAPVADG